MDNLKLVFNALLGIVLFVGILYLAYITTKYIGKRYSLSGKSTRSLKIMETIGLGKDSQLAVVKIGEKYLLVGVTPQNVSLVRELDESDLTVADENEIPPEQMDFKTALQINIAKKFGKEPPRQKQEEKENDK